MLEYPCAVGRVDDVVLESRVPADHLAFIETVAHPLSRAFDLFRGAGDSGRLRLVREYEVERPVAPLGGHLEEQRVVPQFELALLEPYVDLDHLFCAFGNVENFVRRVAAVQERSRFFLFAAG